MQTEPLIDIDGSQGEGGGQILRSTVGLAAVIGKPVRIRNIRAGRSKPGLMRQHLTAVNAVAKICAARISGGELGSSELTFEPGSVSSGCYEFSVGTAGSATLILQTVLPALLQAEGRSEVIIEGGTHNPWAPPFDFLEKVYLPLVCRMGPRIHAELERYGFYPAGGGRIRLVVEPALSLTGFDLCERGRVLSKKARILISNLPLGIARREASVLAERLTIDPENIRIDPVSALGPGNLVYVEIQSENVTELTTSFGRVGASAEHVAKELVQQVRGYLTTDVPVGEYLADQLLLPLGLSAAQNADCSIQRGGSFRTARLSHHALTHINILQTMLPVRISVTHDDRGHLVTTAPI